MSAERIPTIEARAISAADLDKVAIAAGDEFYASLADGASRIPVSQIAAHPINPTSLEIRSDSIAASDVDPEKLRANHPSIARLVDRDHPNAQAVVLRDLQKRIGEANAAKGFHEEGERIREKLETRGIALQDALSGSNPGAVEIISGVARGAAADLRNYETSRIALIVTEAAEAIEELRNGRESNETYYSGGIGYSVEGDLDESEATDANGNPRKPEGVPSEIADVVIRSFDFAHEAGFDLADIIFEKLAYNATRAHKHGRKF